MVHASIFEKRTITSNIFLYLSFKLVMCLRNTDAPGGNQIKIWQQFLSPSRFDISKYIKFFEDSFTYQSLYFSRAVGDLTFLSH